ncbi:MAG: hypothetical protein JW729_06290 [Bacteroidales bacterium]|nr:hypothetical protein [Bacteroidales bacterium]
MIQETIVYIILAATAIHLLLKIIKFFQPINKSAAGCSSCSTAGCGSCSLKFDFDSIQMDILNAKTQKQSK